LTVGFVCYDSHMLLPTEKQEELIQRAMSLAAEAAAQGNLPFAGILADENGNIVLEAKNTVNTTQNAAAHAEINLLYAAGEKLGTNDLSKYIFISNAASCPMCATALIKARITNFYYGAPNEGTMVPNITMDEVVAKTPFAIEVHGGILAEECAEQVRLLAKRA
jgi:tRNA(adenine34) deaminase